MESYYLARQAFITNTPLNTNYQQQALNRRPDLHRAARHRNPGESSLINPGDPSLIILIDPRAPFISPLHDVAYAGNLQRARSLIEEGATIDAKDKFGDTPLHKASSNGHLEVVKLLVDNKAAINAKNGNGYTALHLAAISGQIELVTFLLEQGAHVCSKNKIGKTPKDYANQFNRTDLVKLLELYENGATPLQLASINGDLDTLKLLIDSKAGIEIKDRFGDTPLHLASSNGHLEVVNLLLDNKADVNAKDDFCLTPLHWASNSGHQEVVRLLIDNKADVNAKTDNGWTSLHAAAWYGDIELATLLLKKGSNTCYQDKHGNTPKDLAIRQKHMDMEKLIEQYEVGSKFIYQMEAKTYGTSALPSSASTIEALMSLLSKLGGSLR